MVLGIFFPFLVFLVYLVIFNEDLGPSTFVMGDFGVFFGDFVGSMAHGQVLEALNSSIRWIYGL